MKRFLSILMICLLLSAFSTACSGPGGKTVTREDLNEKAIAMIEKVYNERTFPEDLDLQTHKGLLNNEDVTGPFLKICDTDGNPFIPDLVEDAIVDNPDIADGYKFTTIDDDDLPKEYMDLFHVDDKDVPVSEESKGPVFALLEYTGYDQVGEYNNGNFILYNHVTRVSFYSLEDGSLLAWMNTNRTRSGPIIMRTDQYGSDGTHAIFKYDNGTIWSETAWTYALDELFYDENGYQVIGDRLLSVPEDVSTIEVPDGVTRIDSVAANGTQATELILPDSVKYIGASAFANGAIEKASIPSGVNYVDIFAFSDTPWLEEAGKDGYLVVGDGILINCTDQSEEIVIPSNVKYIAPGALSGLPCKKITIPSTVIECCGSASHPNSSSYAAIMDCEQLEDLVIEGGLKEDVEGPGIVVMAHCKNLKTVEITAQSGELPENFLIQYTDVKKNMTLICPDDSPAARWADYNNVAHRAAR